MNVQPKVSVIIPTYNNARYLPESIDSVLRQSYQDVEIIVVDDGSTDDTPSVLAKYGNDITVIRTENHGGPSRPRNIGIAQAAGGLIALFDSDDIMFPQKLETQVSMFLKYPDMELLSTNFRSIDASGNVLTPDYLREYESFRGILHARGENVYQLGADKLYMALNTSNYIGTSGVMTRDYVLKDNPFDEALTCIEDIDLWLRLALKSVSFYFLDVVLHSYRIRKGSLERRTTERFPSAHHFWSNQMDRVVRTAKISESEIEVLMERRISVYENYIHRCIEERKCRDARNVYQEILAFSPEYSNKKVLLKLWLCKVLGRS
ncbi:MAG: glycosyltransferase family A protein [Pseudomonadota bacterium]